MRTPENLTYCRLRRGFTLIELNVVIVILVLMAALVVPNVVALLRSRRVFDLEAAIIRLPAEAKNEARKSQIPVSLRIEGTSLVMERTPEEGTAQTLKQVSLTQDIQVQQAQREGESTDLSSWRWTVYPDGSADEGGLEFLEGANQKALLLPKRGDARWMDGVLPDASQDYWEAGEIEKRG